MLHMSTPCLVQVRKEIEQVRESLLPEPAECEVEMPTTSQVGSYAKISRP